MNRPQQGFPPILDHRGPPQVRRFGRAALAHRQHHSRQRHRLGPAALALYPLAVRYRGQRRLCRHPRAGEEDGRYRPGFRAVARRREAKANAAALADHKVTRAG